MLGLAAECNSRELKFNIDVCSFIIESRDKCPRNKQSAASNRRMLRLAMEYNSKELKYSAIMFTCSFTTRGEMPKK